MAWFRISFAEKAFLRLLAARGLGLDTMSVDDGVSAMIEFYVEHRAQHTRLEDDGDGLLVRWSPGRLEITRSMTRAGSAESPTWRLSLAFTMDAGLPTAGSERHRDPTAAISVPPFFTGTPTAVTLSYEAD